MADIQRRRILAAMSELACERGAWGVTVGHVVERSGVSRRTFYELFGDRVDCLRQAFDEALEQASERVLAAYRAGGSWRERTRTGLVALLGLFDEQPLLGRLLIVESLSAGPWALERRARVLAEVAGVLEEGRRRAPSGATPPAPPLTAEATVGGVLAVIHTRMTEPGQTPLVALTNELMAMIVLPYLGAGAARRELERPLPSSDECDEQSKDPTLLSEVLKGAHMRLTYRMVRVLTAVAENADASNRTIGDAAGIADQGQISKLLARMERVGLVSNSGLGPGRGAANAWTLTPAGRSVLHGIRAEGERPQ